MKLNKDEKRVLAFFIAFLAATGIIKVQKENANSKIIDLQDNKDNNLSVVSIIDDNYKDEKYGYIITKKNKVTFVDVLNNKKYDLTDKDVYYCDYLSILSGIDYNKVIENNNTTLGDIRYYDETISVINNGNDYGVTPTSNNSLMHKLVKLNTNTKK